jgi:hypothetical protein
MLPFILINNDNDFVKYYLVLIYVYKWALVPLAQVNHLQGFKNTTFQKAYSSPSDTQLFKK